MPGVPTIASDMRQRIRGLFGGGVRPPAIAALQLAVAGLGILALIAPLGAAEQPLTRVGVLLAIAGAIAILHGVRHADKASLRRAVSSGCVTLVMALLVISAPYVAGTALVVFLAASFAVDGAGQAADAWRATAASPRLIAALGALGNFAVCLLLATRLISITWLVAIASALRMFGIAWTMAVTPVHAPEDAGQTVIDELGVGDQPEAAELYAEIAADERVRVSADRRLIAAFLITLFAIHIARQQTDGTLLGLLAPAVAVLGDALLASLFALAIVLPVVLSLRRSTRRLERFVWQWYVDAGASQHRWRHRLAKAWLSYRLRIAIRLREARFSIPVTMRRSLAAGLPIAAIVAATVPIWGMSWFFDTENWASGIWNSWAESRTDKWRSAMVRAVVAASGSGAPAAFTIAPPGGTNGDFSFIVIGDTGEGDASQHVLRDQLLSVAGHQDVRFVIVSSDVIYPNGSMVDYEAKFWLPFKGVTKPVYAIPGNHDWYDALEAFLATFLDAGSARTAMHARANADLRLTSTTAARIDRLIAAAGRLRKEYEVPTGFQRGPFFDMQFDRFALVAIDTGIVKRIDEEEWAWLEAALARARGKTLMAVIGHPFYAGGYDQTSDNEDFARLKRRLLDAGATIMMAGDTHDLEYYVEPSVSGAPPVHYFVNGGGGAYLSFGTSLAWPAQPATATWAHYPNRADVSNKIEELTPTWKRPAWWWTHYAGAWPFSAEWLSAAFDYNVAPFFQSFVEVRVEPSAARIRLVPYGVHGRLRWRDFGRSSPAAAGEDELAEWIVPMR
jgi:uncharacterized membrane protein HdeD (DUF308 family)